MIIIGLLSNPSLCQNQFIRQDLLRQKWVFDLLLNKARFFNGRAPVDRIVTVMLNTAALVGDKWGLHKSRSSRCALRAKTLQLDLRSGQKRCKLLT